MPREDRRSRGWRDVALVVPLVVWLGGCGSEDHAFNDGGVGNEASTLPDQISSDARSSEGGGDARSEISADTTADSSRDLSSDVVADGRTDASQDMAPVDVVTVDTTTDAGADALDAIGVDADSSVVVDAPATDVTPADGHTDVSDEAPADADATLTDGYTDVSDEAPADVGASDVVPDARDGATGDAVFGDGDGGPGDLVVWLPFTGNANDVSGYANHGTVEGGAALTTGRLGASDTAYAFDMADDRIVIADSASTDLTAFQNGYTIAAWVRATDSANTVHMVVAKGDGSFSLNLAGTELRACHRDGSGSTQCQTSANCSATLNQWSHIAVTWDAATEKWQLYNGGAPCSFMTGSRTGLSQVATAPLMVGSDSPTGRFYFQGGMDSVRVYRRALSALEIAALLALD